MINDVFVRHYPFFEPIGEDLAGSSLQVLAGVDEVPGLKDALVPLE